MSAQASPDGSPGRAGQSAATGEMLAMRMIQAAEAAATAAQAATQAVAAMTGSSSSSRSAGGNKPEWYKVLPKPSTFEPKDREAELSGFRDGWWQVETIHSCSGCQLWAGSALHSQSHGRRDASC